MVQLPNVDACGVVYDTGVDNHGGVHLDDNCCVVSPSLTNWSWMPLTTERTQRISEVKQARMTTESKKRSR